MSEKALREVFGESLTELGTTNPDIVVLDADLSSATRSILFGEQFPDRFYNVGITEANMVSIGVGLSTCDLIPYVCTFSFLLTLRATDQIRSHISYSEANVKLMGTNGGLSGFSDGATHQSIMDLAILRAMPNMTVLVPSDADQMRWAVRAVADFKGPAFIRIPRVEAPPVHQANAGYKIGQGLILREGTDVTIISIGMMVNRALTAAEQLAAKGIQAEVVEIHTLKPLDTKIIIDSAAKTGTVVTVEEHSRIGGLFSAVTEVLATDHPVPVDCVAIEDRFAGSGQYDELLAMCGLTVEHIIMKSQQMVQKKDK